MSKTDFEKALESARLETANEHQLRARLYRARILLKGFLDFRASAPWLQDLQKETRTFLEDE